MVCRLHADSTAASSTRKISASVNGEHGGGLFFSPSFESESARRVYNLLVNARKKKKRESMSCDSELASRGKHIRRNIYSYIGCVKRILKPVLSIECVFRKRYFFNCLYKF